MRFVNTEMAVTGIYIWFDYQNNITNEPTRCLMASRFIVFSCISVNHNANLCKTIQIYVINVA